MSRVTILYHQLAKGILEGGYEYTTDNRPDIPCRQISSATLEIPLHEFPLLTSKKMFTKGIVTELLWFLRRDSHINTLLQQGVEIWNKDTYRFYVECHKEYPMDKQLLSYEDWLEKQRSDKTRFSGDAGRIYGQQWRSWKGATHVTGGWMPRWIDQIEVLLHNLRKSNPLNRRHIVTAWNPAELDQCALPPCHWAFEILPRPLSDSQRIQYAGKDLEYLETLWKEAVVKSNPEAQAELDNELRHVPKWGFTLKWHQRSVDTFLGLPFNIASYGLLAYIIGSITDMVPMSLIGDLSNVHFYTKPENSDSRSHIELINEQLKNNPAAFPGPQLVFSDYYMGWLNKYKAGDCSFDDFLDQLSVDDFIFENYQSFPPIKGDMYEPTS